MYRRITLTTDFADTPASHSAFVHALALARHHKALLDIIHIHRKESEADWDRFPKVRTTLQSWGVQNVPPGLGEHTSIDGLRIKKVEMRGENALHGLSHFVLEHGTELVVAASHGRHGLGRMLHGSVMEELLKTTKIPALVIGPEAHGFVDTANGKILLKHVVLPVADSPSPDLARNEAELLLRGLNAQMRLVHARGAASPYDRGTYNGEAVALVAGAPAAAILAFSQTTSANLIVMPTAGTQGLKEKLFGSTTTQVLAQAPCPVLVVPS